MISMANGNWMCRTPVHYCNGCCESVGEAQSKWLSAAFNFLLVATPATPSLNRWLSIENSLSWWGAGFALHDVVAQGYIEMMKQTGHTAQGDEPAQSAEQGVQGMNPTSDFHAETSARMRAGLRFVSDPDSKKRVLMTVVVTAPADAVVQLLSSTIAVTAGRPATEKPILLHLVDGPSSALRL
jgi:hypothetical protein